MIERLSNVIKKEIEGRPTLVFMPGIRSSQGMATALQYIGVNADWVSGADPDREEKIRRYKEGEIQVMCNAQVLTEGFNAPRTAAIVLCRPTKSRPLYSQMVGRGTRLKHGMEFTDCLVIDFA